jgi:phosphoribosylformylglycinamidine synthase
VPAPFGLRNDTLLFSESASRFVVTVHPEQKKRFEECLAGNVFAEIGVVTNQDYLLIKGLHGRNVVTANIFELKEAWQKPLRW